ncbi:MAG TPA: hypothetical protein VLU95_01760, partial [Candidatus Acidoferrum sp.]|nr:hypothetical protein [Candidatus Acidoferrum sp.]
SVSELKEILEHCRALERLGIAQDEEMMISIERDVALRNKETSSFFELKQLKIKQRTTKQNLVTMNRDQQPKEYLMEQHA